MVISIVLEARRKFYPYVYFSRVVVDLWNDIVRLKSRIRYVTAEEAKARETEFRENIEAIRTEAVSTCNRLLRILWLATAEIDPIDVRRAESRVWLVYYIDETSSFETVCVNIRFVCDDALKELEEKIIVIPPIPPEWEYLGTDAETGYDLYYNPTEKNYVSLEEVTLERAYYVKDKKYFREVKRNVNLVVVWTGSLETKGGHQPIAVELTAGAIVTEMGRGRIVRVEDEIERKVVDFAKLKFGKVLSALVIKIGVEYIATDDIRFSISSKGGKLLGLRTYPVIAVIAEFRDTSMEEEL